MKYFTQDVFGTKHDDNIFLRKIKEYEDETGEPIYLSGRIRDHFGCREELELLGNIRQYVSTDNTDLIGSFLSMTTIKKARETYYRSQYFRCKLKALFIENAVSQINEYEPFFLTMDDIHESDSLVLNLEIKKVYYQEKLMSL